ncbi:tetraspanin-18 isoform X1 [Dendrobium catenatum]|uniref:tetraspanin-18 isoform X1 n=1 Tax=Dendrobium catenatum TaxID=906689 RepID=UPI0010A02D38|nr:tetraspanin-18 isoform X1 [Dendrobium catenatum]
MRPNCCRSCLVFLLKMLNFLQTFVGVSILIYSVWVLNQTIKHGLSFSLDLDRLPAPWFVCALMGVGIMLCLVAFTGHIAAEAVSSCCLCFYASLITMMILLEAALVGDLFFNKEWKKDLPKDSTGELKNLIAFIEDNIDICKWAGVSIVVIQETIQFRKFKATNVRFYYMKVNCLSPQKALSLLLAVLIRAMIPSRSMDYDSDEDYFVIRRPLLNQQGGHGTTSGFHSDIWSSRMKQKYGLNPNHITYNAGDPKLAVHQQQLC